ncbi:MAG: hypothetical protein VXY93_14960, partial [Pseudomonadota bacterium]|nr:hypothetical protein [Pseudomonadota bacterium]
TGAEIVGTIVATGADINGDIDVDGHTNLDNVSVAGVSTFSDNLKIIDDKKIIVGNGQGGVNDLEIFHQSSNNYNYIKSPARGFIIQNASMNATYIAANYFNLTNANFSQTYATANNYGINLRYNNDQKLRTASSGIQVIGVTTTTGLAVTGVSTFTGNIDANGDLDVDGHTNLDNLDVVGVATFTGSKFNIESTGESFVKRTGGGGGAIALIVSGDQNGQPLIEFRHGGSGIGQIKKIGTSGLRFTSDTLALRS